MLTNTYHLWTKTNYSYPATGCFLPNIVTYIHDEDEKTRPAMVVVPGGGYKRVSPAEGELVAKKFYNEGFNSFVVTYTTNLLEQSPLKLQPLMDLSKAVMFLRKNAEIFKIIPDKLTVCGFSAGGHLSASLAAHYDAKELKIGGEYENISNRPDAVILSYPVISSTSFVHKDSFLALLGEDTTKEELEYMSLEKHVSEHTPPTFLWHTATDQHVPVENSYLFADACKAQGVSFELHVFGNGEHGLSLANKDWASGNYNGYYTLQQYIETIEFCVKNNIELPPSLKNIEEISKEMSLKDSIIQGVKNFSQRQPDEGIAIWPHLALRWLEKVL
ncbi:acetyl esterase/lipase [Metabacillus crassostreae]|uniref:alpha/beta hydrolase n=1 Tax=Metabacillus crassostreae TaxID=929098 RepID=UPI00195D293E|nr:alpha/beta hydrolase [Metabacillus crassostreae]MBM7603911.1 acetyl esterase/lipase [Metabacillus crassostreae]